MVTHRDPRKGPVDRTPPTGRLTVTTTLTSGNVVYRASAGRGEDAGAPKTASTAWRVRPSESGHRCE